MSKRFQVDCTTNEKSYIDFTDDEELNLKSLREDFERLEAERIKAEKIKDDFFNTVRGQRIEELSERDFRMLIRFMLFELHRVDSSGRVL